MSDHDVGVLLTNLGTPDAPTPAAVRRYLAEFLWDPRVVEVPRPLWWLVLNGIILRTRPRRSAAAYAKIWGEQGSPLLTIAERQAEAVRSRLTAMTGERIPLALGMRYGNPSIASGLDRLREAGCRRILVLPLYPQYAASTTASTFDAINHWLRRQRDVPALRLVRDYHDDPGYLDALATSIREYRDQHGRGDLLVFSFHGIPKRYVKLGDPYPAECGRTVQGVVERLGLARGEWKTTFQSRFGPQQWLQPYTDRTLERLPTQGVRRIDLVCPGFSADCLETLEENDMGNREAFLGAGGEAFHYIPCLNDRSDHIDALTGIIRRELAGWLDRAPALRPSIKTPEAS
jgi:ferrochelatase